MVKRKILLDTTYLLPLFGIDVGLSGYEVLFPRLLEEYRVYYTPLSLVESKLIVLKLSKMKPELSDKFLIEYRKGLDTIISNDKLEDTIITNGVIEEVADHLLRMGLRDYFDRMIYATAYYYNTILLTEDNELKSINEKVADYKLPGVVTWREIKRGIL